MSEYQSEKSEMSCIEFAQNALRDHVAPPEIGSTKARLLHAARKLGWSYSRVKNVWYADDRVSLGAEELRQLEEYTGLRYGRKELRSVEELIARADALLVGPDADFHRPFVAAFRAFVRALDSSGIEG